MSDWAIAMVFIAAAMIVFAGSWALGHWEAQHPQQIIVHIDGPLPVKIVP